MNTSLSRILIAVAVLFSVGASAPILLHYRFEIEGPIKYHAEYQGTGTYSRHRGQASVPRPLTTSMKALFQVNAQRVTATAGRHGGAARPTYEVLFRPEAFNHVLSTDTETDRVVVGPGVLKVTRNDRPVFDLAGEKIPVTGMSREFALVREPIRIRMDHLGREMDLSGMDRMRLLLPQLAFDELLVLSLVRLPEEPVRPGDTWDADYPLSLPHCPRGGCRIPVQHRLVKPVQIRGYDCARIAIDGTVDLAQGDFTHGGGADIVSGSDTRYNYYFQRVTGEADVAIEEGVIVGTRLHVQTSYNAVFAYVESGVKPTEVRVDLELAVDSELRLDGEKAPEGQLDRIRRWIDGLF